MATQTGTTLKTYFNKGDQPTESNFGDLIDSNLNLTDGGTVAGSTTFTNSITASGDISCSGTVIADNFESTGGDDQISFVDNVTVTGNLTSSGTTKLGDNTADYVTITGNITSSGTIETRKFLLVDPDVAHGITNVSITSAYGDLGPIHGTRGGLLVNGTSDQESADARSLTLRGLCNDTHTDTVPVVELNAAKRSGTSIQALASAETVLQVQNHTTELLTVLGDGKVGIGTTTPAEILEVVGNISASGNLLVNNIFSNNESVVTYSPGTNTAVFGYHRW